jgi:DNA (cytosine-5)-methyltransferase 1
VKKKSSRCPSDYFIDLFAGIGGFHLGLSRSADNSSYQAQVGEGKGETGLQQHGVGVLDVGNIPDSEEHRLGQVDTSDQQGRADIRESRVRNAESRGKSQLSGSSGFRCVWANEWDKYAAQTYRKNFPETPLSTDDIREVNADSIPDHDLLCAGFPCQAFSVAGKRKGLEEARGTLFYEIARIAERKRPRLLLLENVKGLLSHDEGRTFATILRVMGSIGYRLEWQVLNSKWFGVPQNRERVFIIGHLGDTPTRTIFPITEISGNPPESQGEARGNGSRLRDEGESHAGALRVGGSGLEDNLIAGTLSHRYGKDGSENLIETAIWGHPRNYQRKGVYEPDEVYRSLRTSQRPPPPNYPYPDSEKRIRRLTPTECERLQGFPDGWTEGVSDTQRYKQLGNAVTVNVIRFLGERIQQLWRLNIE